MKKLLFIFLIVCFFFSPSHASAHLIGQAPFFEVNGKYSNFYVIPTTSLENFPLAQDGGPENYLVNQPISFVLDTSKLPVPPEIIKISKFTWDFGDGEKGSGLTNTHVYKKMGSYLLSIDVDDGTNPTPQLLESVQLTVLPYKDYKLPQAHIVIDGLSKPNASANEYHLPLHQPVQFDATQSTAGSSPIVSYFWDRGDSTTQTTSQFSYTYSEDTRLAFVVLRIKDKNGFIADAYTAVRNDTGIVLPTPTRKTTSFFTSKPLFTSLGSILILFGIISGIIMLRRSK